MTKVDLTEAIQDAADMTKRDALDALEGLIDIIKATLETGESLKITNFGTFEVKQKNERVGRNPQTGESIVIAPRQIVTFNPSKLLRQGLNDGCNLTMSKPLKRGRRLKKGTWLQEELSL